MRLCNIEDKIEDVKIIVLTKLIAEFFNIGLNIDLFIFSPEVSEMFRVLHFKSSSSVSARGYLEFKITLNCFSKYSLNFYSKRFLH